MSQFTKDRISIEKKALVFLNKSGRCRSKFLESLSETFFESKARKFIFKIIKKLNKTITFDIFSHELQKRGKNLSNEKKLKYEQIFLNLSKIKTKKKERDYIFEELFRIRRIDKNVDSMKRYLDLVDNGDIDEAEKYLVKNIFESEAYKQGYASVLDEGEVYEDYKLDLREVEDRGKYPEKYRGLKTGIRKIDKATGGLWNGELGMLLGASSVGKTTEMLNIIIHSVLKGKKIIIFVNEMPVKQYKFKFASNITKIEYKNFKFGNLSKKQKRKWKSRLDGIHNMGGSLKIVSISQECTIRTIHTYLEACRNTGVEYDMIVIDSIDWLDSGSRSYSEQHNIGLVSMHTKNLALSWNKPVWAVTQRSVADYDADEMSIESMGYGRKKFFLADIVFGMERNDIDKEQKKISWALLKDRDGPVDKVNGKLIPNFKINRIIDEDRKKGL